MRLMKLMAILMSLAIFAWGCELDEEDGTDATNGGSDVVDGDTGGMTDPCEGMTNPVTDGDVDLVGDDNCDQSAFFDTDCTSLDDNAFTFRCGKSKCDFTTNVCEAMQPCGAVWCYAVGDIAYSVAKPCPNDPDCFAANNEPPLPCEADGHCDTWCPVDTTGASIDIDCAGNAGAGSYCPGGVDADQCN